MKENELQDLKYLAVFLIGGIVGIGLILSVVIPMMYDDVHIEKDNFMNWIEYTAEQYDKGFQDGAKLCSGFNNFCYNITEQIKNCG